MNVKEVESAIWIQVDDAKSQNATFPVHSLEVKEEEKVNQNNKVELKTIAANEKSQQPSFVDLFFVEVKVLLVLPCDKKQWKEIKGGKLGYDMSTPYSGFTWFHRLQCCKKTKVPMGKSRKQLEKSFSILKFLFFVSKMSK